MSLEITTLLGAGFAGGIASFIANTIKDIINRKKEDERVYENFKMNLFGELHSLRYELSDTIKRRDYAHMEFIDLFYQNTGQKIDRSEVNIAEAKFESENVIVRELEIKFFKQLSFYMYKKKYKTKVADLERLFKTESLKYEPDIIQNQSGDIIDYLKLSKRRSDLYEKFHAVNVGMRLAEITRCVMDDV